MMKVASAIGVNYYLEYLLQKNSKIKTSRPGYRAFISTLDGLSLSLSLLCWYLSEHKQKSTYPARLRL